MNESRHAELRELLGAHSLGLLEADERARLEEHLAGCAECRVELAELRPLGPALDQVDPDLLAESVRMPDTVGPWLRRQVAAERAGRSVPEPAGADPGPPTTAGAGVSELAARRRPSRPRLARPGLLVAAAAVAVVLAGFVGYQVAPAPSAVAMEPVPVSTTGAESDVRASASLVAHTWGVEVKLEATGFDSGERYQVQVLDRDGGSVSAGEFVGTGEESMLCNLNSSVLRPDATGFQVLDDRGESILSSTF